MLDFYTDIPTWDNGKWTITSFKSREDFREYILGLFKEPGLYDFDESSFIFNEQARRYNKEGFYIAVPGGSKDYITYWDEQKVRCRKGVIVHHKNKTWFLAREYYMWLNFMPINNKEKRSFTFPDIRDAQYHLALYELLAELYYKHAAVLKKRQIASSYYHCAKFINQIWFEETPILKMGASLKGYLLDSWKFLVEYKNFLDENTAWYRHMSPAQPLNWQQQIEVTIPGTNRKTLRGLKGVIKGTSFEQEATAGVGGPCTYFFHEEAGVAKDMMETYGFMKPALKSGMITTGTFIAAGSVGDLDQCEPLKEMILNPEANDIFYVETDLLDANRTVAKTGLFIPEQWSMPPCVDEYGNSKVEEALKMLDEYFAKKKKELSPQAYQLEISQHPRNIEEAFATRTVSIFPTHLVANNMRKIQDKEFSYQFMDINKTTDGTYEAKLTNKLPISEFPVTKNTEDKTGVLVVYEKPDANAPWGTYYGSIDPVSEGKTTTSESLCSIYIYKNPVEVTLIDGNDVKTYIERDKIVASWCGRYDDINKTHEKLESIIEWYNAWTIVENNISLFIQYMIGKRKQKYLVPKDQVLFLKDLGSNRSVYSDYGWKNTGTLFKSHLLSYLIEFLREEIDEETSDDGKVMKITYGIERIPDLMAMKEMMAYREGLNVDRLVALAALVAFAKVQQSNRGYRKRVDRTDKKHLEKSENLYKLDKSLFRNIGSTKGGSGNRPPRNPFRNIR